MKQFAAVLLSLGCLVLSACGSSGGSDGGNNGSGNLPPLPAPDGQGQAGPAAGSERAGRSYDVTLTATDGERIVFTVHEPAQLVGGQKYPVLLHGSGFSIPRITAAMRNFAAPAGTPLVNIQTSKQYTDAGYAVVSFDQRGFGTSSGTVTIMDPDKDGANLLQVVDWIDANLDWTARRDGNLVLGAYGGSYGGGYQLMLNNIDPRHRLDAIVPQITWYDLSYSLGSGDVPKSGYGLALTAAGEVLSGLQMDPSVLAVLQHGLTDNRYTEEDQAMLRYHSNRYFCEGVSQVGKRAAVHPPRVDALFFQGMYDALFNLNEAKANYECLSESGGDVRLLTYNIGHVLPGGVGLISGGLSGPSDFSRCGPWEAGALSLQWFDAKLKRDPAAIAALREVPEHCITLSSNAEGVVVNRIKTGGTQADVPATLVPLLLPVSLTPVTLYTATEDGTVVAGIPTSTLTLENPLPIPGLPGGLPLGVSTDDAFVFVSLARSRAALPSQLETLGDQVRPVRGFGTHTIELNGIGVKLNAGDRIDLLVTAASLPQYPLIIARNPLLPAVRVSGTVQLPVLGAVETVH
ncbi:CocE/NonD family hydrolase [Solimonas sp. K1W22B-7]|uniref:CocE/NonD family hydrolase n=1 Tax=Solimonas sp. K1W22B-7 TaxID=2303331 RepID=UPI0013C43391|nr:CocE/NonD family hydrolase [Solimonas sp. K1W22B-7]